MEYNDRREVRIDFEKQSMLAQEMSYRALQSLYGETLKQQPTDEIERSKQRIEYELTLRGGNGQLTELDNQEGLD